ncbi:MAG: T9SS type A sorting domain-containing protein [Flavobacteriales bacterium]|nr:T9SS type A sorting domain-containing protein [Flavobacteriales bacterium]
MNVTRVAYYDTSDTLEVCCYGMWGVYPFLPSGKILGSDRQKGLYIFRLDLPVDQENPQVHLFPNPGNGELTLDLVEIKAAELDLLVFDSVGRLVHADVYSRADAHSNWATLDLSRLPQGTYFLKFIWEAGVASTEFIHQAN